MATRYCGLGGNDGNSGLTWALRKLTLNGVEDTPVAAGDVVYVGPGVYRELLTVDVSGGNAYVVGTVDVANGSKQVDGNGTAWVANVAADYMFHIAIYASGNDGVTNGDNTFTSAAGNFQAAMIGKPIQIMTKGAYVIATVVNATSITISDPNGLGWPADGGGGLTYSVMSGEGHYDVNSVDDNTTIQLKQPWNGPTLTTVAYITFNPIRYIGDQTGEHTDGVGGVVRITGSDNDQAAARAQVIRGAVSRTHRVFRSFNFDLCTSNQMVGVDAVHWVIEDCTFSDTNAGHLAFEGASQSCVTIRRCVFNPTNYEYHVVFKASVAVDDSGHLVENWLCAGARYTLRVERIGGMTARNLFISGDNYRGIDVIQNMTTGQTLLVTNSTFAHNAGQVLDTLTLGMIIEDYNSFFGNTGDRQNVGVGANSLTYPPLLTCPILHAGADQVSGFKFSWRFGELSEWSQVRAIAGAFEAYGDLHGIVRPATASKRSWGSCQFTDMELESGTVQAGTYSRVLHDAGQVLARRIPVTGVEITVTLYVRREANYAGDLPQMIIKQPGQVDQTTVSVAAVNTWEQLSDTFTPASPPGFVEVWVESRNTAAAGNYEVFYDTMGVS